MNAVSFLARDAAHAVQQIHARLGSDAVVLSVGQVPVSGFSRLWRRPQLEVLAGVPDATPPPVANSIGPTVSGYIEPADAGPAGLGGTWRSAGILRQLGLLPLYVNKVLDRVRTSHGDIPPASLLDEFSLVRAALVGFWRPATRAASGSPSIHVFIGPPGSGKTTALCKWLAKSVLAEGRSARAWRLDGRAANFAGLLDAYGEILGVPVEREWLAVPTPAGFDVGFIDLPGLEVQGPHAVEQLRARLSTIASAQVHLVLNAAYDVSVLLSQARAFSALPVNDVIFTHLDEEKKPAKLWNVVLGTNFTVRFLSGGQNIPGDFYSASAEALIPRQIRA
jgi:flagellar biosynthesis protein FlhF